MAADWYRCHGHVWCELFKVDLNHKYLRESSGVFVIWTGSDDNPSVLKVGCGPIPKRLSEIKKELAIQAFKHLGLFVSWTEMSSIKQKGVELYLINELTPKMQDEVPKAIPVKINLPWDEVDDD